MNKRSLLAGASIALLTGSFATAALAQSPDAGAVDLPHPAHIHDGLCPTPGDVAQPLSDLVIGTDAAMGAASVNAPFRSAKVFAFTIWATATGDLSASVVASIEPVRPPTPVRSRKRLVYAVFSDSLTTIGVYATRGPRVTIPSGVVHSTR